jgi:hypothetical protein
VCRALDISGNPNIAVLPDTLTLLGQLSYVDLFVSELPEFSNLCSASSSSL